MKLLPRENVFFERFETHGKKVVEGCRLLQAMVTEPPADMQSAAGRVKLIEHECDEITHAVVGALHSTFITPIERNDIHRLVCRIDDVIDLVDNAAERLWLYALPTMTDDVKLLADCLVKAAEHVLTALIAIRDLKKPKAILNACVEINRLENVTDKVLRSALSTLFTTCQDPVQIIKWKEIYETLEAATDRCEDVADIIEGVVLENS